MWFCSFSFNCSEPRNIWGSVGWRVDFNKWARSVRRHIFWVPHSSQLSLPVFNLSTTEPSLNILSFIPHDEIYLSSRYSIKALSCSSLLLLFGKVIHQKDHFQVPTRGSWKAYTRCDSCVHLRLSTGPIFDSYRSCIATLASKYSKITLYAEVVPCMALVISS